MFVWEGDGNISPGTIRTHGRAEDGGRRRHGTKGVQVLLRYTILRDAPVTERERLPLNTQ